MAKVMTVIVCALAGGAFAYSNAPAPAPMRPGVGLPLVGQPAQERRPDLPRSTNKRVLPATPEPGLWAADGEPRATVHVTLEDIAIPMPENRTAGELFKTELCADGMRRAIDYSGRKGDVAKIPPEVLNCLVARLHLACASDLLAKFKDGSFGVNHGTAQHIEESKRVKDVAQKWATNACREEALRKGSGDIFDAVIPQWRDLLDGSVVKMKKSLTPR